MATYRQQLTRLDNKSNSGWSFKHDCHDCHETKVLAFSDIEYTPYGGSYNVYLCESCGAKRESKLGGK